MTEDAGIPTQDMLHACRAQSKGAVGTGVIQQVAHRNPWHDAAQVGADSVQAVLLNCAISSHNQVGGVTLQTALVGVLDSDKNGTKYTN